MTLSGKETKMRRGACLLALLGMTVQSAVADDLFSPGAARATLPTKTATAPALSPTSLPATTPQRFTRSAASSQEPNDELRNYYKELFGTTPPTTTPPTQGTAQLDASPQRLTPTGPSSLSAGASATSGNSAMKSFSSGGAAIGGLTADGVTRDRFAASGSNSVVGPSAIPGASAAAVNMPVRPSTITRSTQANPAAENKATLNQSDDSQVIHAEFRDQTAPGEKKIQQVHEEYFSARPFPGAMRNSSAQVFEDSAFGRNDTTIKSSPRPATAEFAAKTTPSTTTPTTTTAGESRGSVSFSRGGSSSGAVTPASASRITTAAVKKDASASSVTQTPTVSVEWRKQSDLNVGQECVCHLIVKNSGQTAAREMEVQAYFPESVRLINAKPAPSTSDRYLSWKVEELKPSEVRTIEITMIPLQRGDINTRAEVRFSGVANGRFAVAEPMLDIKVEGPEQVIIGESAAQIVTVSNPGTGIASHVQIEALIPEGLEHARGQRLQMDLGNLNPGESRSVRLALAAAKGGPQHLTVNARAESGLARSATSDVNVIAPSLTASIQGPGLRYLGRQASFVMSVTNAGEAPSDNVQMRYKMPSGFDFVSADRGAQYDPATGLVTWFVGRLERGQKSEIKVKLLDRQSGELKQMDRASSEHGAVADAEFISTVEGTPSLAVQVKDLEDPVEVSSEMSYEIRIRNEGSAAAKGVALTCELADGMSLVTAEGPAEYLSERNSVVFRSIPEVGAGQNVVFKVKVKSNVAGSLRFRALLSSESVPEPLTAEEMTKFYGE